MKNTTEIIYYDFDRLDWLSFYIDGFLANQKKFNYRFRIKREVPSFLEQPSSAGKWQKHLIALGVFEYRNENDTFFFCIDRSDHSSNYMNEGYFIPILENVKYYFKANYNRVAIENDRSLKKYSDKIIPVGLSFPVHTANMMKLLVRVIPNSKSRWKFRVARQRISFLIRVPRLNYLRNLRRIEPDLNIFFVLPYYSNQEKLNDYRYEVMKALAELGLPKTIIGFACNGELPGKFQDFKQPEFRRRTYYRNLARSKVTIYVRGPHNGISSKLGQLLALGKPIIGQSIYNNKEVYYQNQFFDQQFAYDEPEDIANHVRELLQQPEKAATFGNANANTFDKEFLPGITVSRLIEKLLTKTESIEG